MLSHTAFRKLEVRVELHTRVLITCAMGSDNGPKPLHRRTGIYVVAIIIAAALAAVAVYPPQFLLNECPRLVKSSLSWVRGQAGGGVAGERLYTVAELAKYDGTDPEKPILLAFNGDVFDVTKGKQFYGEFCHKTAARGVLA